MMSRLERPVVQDQDEYKAMVWNRGPDGDFVYENLGWLGCQLKRSCIDRCAELRD